MGVIDCKSFRSAFLNITACATLLVVTLFASPAQPATITVVDMNDAVSHSVMCTLRDAINAINNGADNGCTAVGVYGTADTINVPAGTYTLMPNLQGPEDANWTGDLDITTAVTINGAGVGATIIQAGTLGYPNPLANGVDRVFHITFNVPVTFDGMTIQNGNTTSTGGGIFANGPLTLTNSTLSGNNSAIDGGGARSIWGATIISSTITNNSAGWRGGAINGGAISLTNSTISNNVASALGGTWSGGGIYTSSGDVTLNNSVMSGNTSGNNGGIYTLGVLTLTDSTIDNNSAGGNGGIFGGAITLTNSTVSNNTATINNSGGIWANQSLTMTNSTVSNNTANGWYGGITALGPVTLTNSTVSNNTATTNNSGGIYSTALVTLSNSTIYGNISGANGGGLYGNGAGFSLTTSNSIISNNTGGDCFKTGGTFTSTGYNIDSDNSCGLVGVGDLPATSVASLALAPLANNGGPTMTHSLLFGSLAIDAGTCVNASDQRGIIRPQGLTCDIGAYEEVHHLLTTTVSGGGSVTADIGAIICPGVCNDFIYEGLTVTLTATPDPGEAFTGWSGACTGTVTTCVVTMSGAQNVSASFGGLGCTDPTATNYNPLAVVDDGSCIYTTTPPPATNSITITVDVEDGQGGKATKTLKLSPQ